MPAQMPSFRSFTGTLKKKIGPEGYDYAVKGNPGGAGEAHVIHM